MEMIERIRDSIESIAKHIEILPATGDSAQDLLRADEEEIEDQQRVADDPTLGQNKTRLFETPAPRAWNVFFPTPALARPERHLFHFFLDGSVHGRALGTGLEGPRAFPLGLFQIGAAATQRDEDGHLFPHVLQHRILITIPAGAGGLSDTAWDKMMMTHLQTGRACQIIKIEAKSLGRGRRRDADDMRLNASAIVYGHMHHLEVDLCEQLQTSLQDSRRAIIDGSVQFGRFINNPLIIGVAKKFWAMPALQLEDTRLVRLNLTAHLARLPVAHRTAVFEAHTGDVGFWYVRLRPARYHPIEGVVKVELPRPQPDQPVDTEEATFLSRAIIAERTPTPFGIDRRWPSLLYPIHHTEELLKRGFLSEQIIDRLVQAVMYTVHH